MNAGAFVSKLGKKMLKYSTGSAKIPAPAVGSLKIKKPAN
jgi:hypothetical protein